MDQHELREQQRPLKERYREDAASALTLLGAVGGFTDPGITATVESFAGPVRAGLHRATGGDGSDACSGDMLLEALLACAGVTLRSVATALGLDVRDAVLEVTGAFDARGTLGLDRSVPVGVSDVVVTATLDVEATEEQLTKLGQLTERYCVVGQSLATPPRIVVRRG
jgi:uncharacterized OsmC-like protein